MNKGPNINQLIEALYECLIDQGRLGVVMHRVSKAIESQTGHIEAFSVNSAGIQPIDCPTPYVSQGLEDHMCQYLQNGVETNPYFPLVAPSMRVGRVMYANDIIPYKESKLTDHHQQWFVPMDCKNISAVCMEFDGANSVIAEFHHPKPELSAESRMILEQLAPHLVRFYKVNKMLEASATLQNSMWEVMNKFKYGVVLLNYQGQPVFINTVAQTVLELNDGLSLRQGKLTVHCRTAQAQFNAVVGQMMLSGGRADSEKPPDQIIIRRPSGNPSYQLMVSPIGATVNALYKSTPVMAVFIIDPEAPLNLTVEQLRDLYDLTPTEARLAILIAKGKSLEDCALQLKHQISTSRNLLKRVFQKTCTGKQHELTAVLLKHSFNVFPFNHDPNGT